MNSHNSPKRKRRDRSFIFGLYLFLRQLQLSIDRSTPAGASWRELQLYFKERIPVEKVLAHIANSTGAGPYELATKPPRPVSWLAFLRKLTLSDAELQYVVWWLTEARRLLGEDDPCHDTVIDVRYNLACCEELLSTRLGRRDRRVVNVEHYNQNPILHCKPIHALVGHPWPGE